MIIPDCLMDLQLENIYEYSKKALSGLVCWLILVLKADDLPEEKWTTTWLFSLCT
jgi:hypothetical protein